MKSSRVVRSTGSRAGVGGWQHQPLAGRRGSGFASGSRLLVRRSSAAGLCVHRWPARYAETAVRSPRQDRASPQGPVPQSQTGAGTAACNTDLLTGGTDGSFVDRRANESKVRRFSDYVRTSPVATRMSLPSASRTSLRVGAGSLLGRCSAGAGGSRAMSAWNAWSRSLTTPSLVWRV